MVAVARSGELDAYLRFLGRAIVLVRLACMSRDVERAETIADAVHNLPLLLVGGGHAPELARFDELYVRPLVTRYPDLDELRHQLPGVVT